MWTPHCGDIHEYNHKNAWTFSQKKLLKIKIFVQFSEKPYKPLIKGFKLFESVINY